MPLIDTRLCHPANETSLPHTETAATAMIGKETMTEGGTAIGHQVEAIGVTTGVLEGMIEGEETGEIGEVSKPLAMWKWPCVFKAKRDLTRVCT
jgi:hypothetical protein